MVTGNGIIESGLLDLPEEKLIDLENQTVKMLAMIRSARNMSRTVNRIPPEIFIKVFEVRDKERDLVTAAQVCARWRSILTSTPWLWTKVDFEYPARASIYLERSKTALIDVTVGKSRDCIVGPVGTFIGATPWISRMKSLSIQTDIDQIKKIAERLCDPTPNLQALTFEGKPRQYSYTSVGGSIGGAIYVPREFLGRHAPLLQSLKFHTVSPSVVFNFPLPNLTHIDWVAETAHVVVEELLDLFVTSPMIEVVKMHVLVRRTRAFEPLREVTLNQLRRLDWADGDGATCVLSCLTAPKLTQLAIKVTRNPQQQWSSLSSILPPNGSQIPLLLEPTAMEYVYKEGSRSCRLSYDEDAYAMIREVAKTRSEIPDNPWFSPDIPLTFWKTQVLTLEATGGCPSLEDIPIEHFGSLQKLELVGETEALAPLIQSGRGISGNTSVPCPTLSEICVIPKERYFTLEVLTKVLTQRKEAGFGGVNTVRVQGVHKVMRMQVRDLEEIVEKVITT